MTPEQFCYWMQGFVELSGGNPPTTDQWTSIGEHLQQVFNKKTPPIKITPAPEVNPAQVPPFNPDRPNPWSAPWEVDHNKIIC